MLASPHKNRIVLAAAILGLVIFITSLITFRSYENYSKAVLAAESGETLKAITLFERSALWYAPVNPYWRKSIDELSSIAGNNDSGKSLFAARAMNSIERIGGQIDPWAGKEFKKEDKTISGIPVFYRILIHFTFWGWFAALLMLFFTGFSKSGKIKAKPAFSFTAASILFLAAWLYLLAA